MVGNTVETLFRERQRGNTYLSTSVRNSSEFFISQPLSDNVKASDIMVSVIRSQISKIRYANINMYYCDSSCRESLISVTKHLAYLIMLHYDSTMLHALIAIAISLRHRSCSTVLCEYYLQIFPFEIISQTHRADLRRTRIDAPIFWLSYDLHSTNHIT